jgi:hypothetical protein
MFFGIGRRNKELPWIEEGKKVFGLHEVRDNSKLKAWLRSDGQTLGDPKALPWCFSGDTEILTKNGWQRFDALTSEKVCQVDEYGNVSLTSYFPIEKEYSDKAYKVKTNRVSVICDKNHKWWGNWGNIGRKKIKTDDKFGTLDEINSQGLTIRHFNAKDKPNSFSEEQLHMMAAFISDGFFHRGRIEFQVSKQRKIDLLTRLKPIYTYVAPKVYGELSKMPLTTIQFNIPEWFSSVFCDRYKIIPMNIILNWSKNECIQFLTYYKNYDGSIRSKDGRITLYTSDEAIRDMLLTIISLAGFSPTIEKGGKSALTRKQSWRIGFVEKSKNIKVYKSNIEQIDYEGKMYCVTVPESRIIVRGNNKIPFVTGNCGDYTETAIKNSLPNEKFVGVMVQNPYWARNWLHFGVQTTPVYGAIVVFSRGNGGHVGFVVGEDNTDYYVLGGNQSDSVNIVRISKSRLLGCRWPASYANPNRPLPRMTPTNIPKSTNEF